MRRGGASPAWPAAGPRPSAPPNAILWARSCRIRCSGRPRRWPRAWPPARSARPSSSRRTWTASRALDPALNAFVDVRADGRAGRRRAARTSAPRTAGRAGRSAACPSPSRAPSRWTACAARRAARRAAAYARPAMPSSCARLRAAGAIVLGTTNVAEMLMGYETDNPLHGRTNNPWDARSHARRLERRRVGRDCRWLFGRRHRQRRRRVDSRAGALHRHLRTEADARARALHGPSAGVPRAVLAHWRGRARWRARSPTWRCCIASWPAGTPDDPMATPLAADARPAPGHGRAVAWFDAHPDGAAHRGHAGRGHARRGRARDAQGYRDVGVPPARRSTGARPLWDVFFGDMGELLLAELLGGRERALPIVAALHAERGPRAPLTAGLGSHTRLDRSRSCCVPRCSRRCATTTCWCVPWPSVPAFRHGERAWTIDGRAVGYLDAMLYTQWFNILGNPAAVVRAGWSDEGLPIGVQVVGRPFEEHLVLDVAAAIERGCGGWVAPPPVGRPGVSAVRACAPAVALGPGGLRPALHRPAGPGGRVRRARRPHQTAPSRSCTSWPPSPWDSPPGPTP